MSEFRIGDTVNVDDSGHTYSSFVSKAVEMGADVNGYVYRYVKAGEEFRQMDFPAAKKNEGNRWMFNKTPKHGDGCKIIDISEEHVLIERIYDGRQFIIDKLGLRLKKRGSLFEDTEFLL